MAFPNEKTRIHETPPPHPAGTMSGIFLVAAKRTPFGGFGGAFRSRARRGGLAQRCKGRCVANALAARSAGALKNHTATDMAVEASKAALNAGKVDPKLVDQAFFGAVSQTSEDAPYLARHVALRSGVPIEAPALTLNRLCGSGFQSVISGAEAIMLGGGDVMLCGGACRGRPGAKAPASGQL